MASGLLCHVIISLWIQPIRGQTRVFLTFKLTAAATHDTLDTEQFISHTRTVLVDTIACLQGSDGSLIAVSEMHELLTKTQYIIDSAVSKWVGNVAHILAYLF